ncbi:hypothetical protein DID96_37795 [Burkholderia sp. Bp8963]|nr:hypothetical protein DID96_37795 [Burkholderia sp. Bp8963]
MGLPRERPLAALRSLAIRPVFAASRASRAAVLVATHVRSVCKQTLGVWAAEVNSWSSGKGGGAL